MTQDEQTAPIFDTREMSHVYKMWFVEYSDKNLLAVLYEDSKTKTPVLKVRTRVFKDDKAHDSSDRKLSWKINARPGVTVYDFIEQCNTSLRGIIEEWPEKPDVIDIVDINGSAEEFAEIIISKPWANAKKIEKEKDNA